MFVQELENADYYRILIAYRQAQHTASSETETSIDLRFKAFIGVRIFEIDDVAVSRHPAGNSLRGRQADLLLFET
jgi:hypothetical protein